MPTSFSPGVALPLGTLTVHTEQANALGHLAAAQYVVLFDKAFMTFVTEVGLTDDRLRHGATTPVLKDLHACYLKEVKPGHVLAMDGLVLSFDDQRLRLFLSMRLNAGDLAATCELSIVNLDLKSGRPTPWSEVQRAVLDRLSAAHRTASVPPQAGRACGPKLTTLGSPA